MSSIQREQISPYPRLSIDLGVIETNVRVISRLCAARGMRLTCVVKGAGGLPRVAQAMARGGCSALACSRLAQLRTLRDAGIALPLGLLRIPGPSEIDEVVTTADWSLQSNSTALELVAAAAQRVGHAHGVVLMLDLGDLREGWFDDDEFVAEAVRVEHSMTSLALCGIGTNLGCYGSVLPTPENLGRLVAVARRIEDAIGRTLGVVSGGATSSLPLLLGGGIPSGITELRIGEGVLCPRNTLDFYHVDIPGIRSDAFTLRAEIVEIRKKPSYPVGERSIDAFGNMKAYEDRGVRTRLLLALGNRDVGNHDYILPRDPRIHIVGASSDHLICEADEPCDDLRYGSVLEFDPRYAAILFSSDDPYVEVDYT